MSLLRHHERYGREYDNYVKESFRFFREFLSEIDVDKLEEMSNKEFQNMGYFYVVGNEMAKSMLQELGIEKFRNLIEECKINPQRMIEEYRMISKKYPEAISL